MPDGIDADRLVAACADDSFEAGIKIVTELEPLAGPGAPVKPPVYEGGRYQLDRRWAAPDADRPTDVVVLDNVPSQANRLEAVALRHRSHVGLPELRLDLSSVASLPAHLPPTISSWQFPHRNGDAYLRDALHDGQDFLRSDLGGRIFAATPWEAGPLLAWFPQALLFGFWQSHLGKKRTNAKHARAWVSEIIGWRPAATDTRVLGLKGDPLNLSTDETVTSNPDDREDWAFGKARVEGGKADRLSEMGHGQVIFMREGDTAPAGVSFARISQTTTVSFAQLRRVSLGTGSDNQTDATARALLVGIGLFAHAHAFGRGFELRSGADLRPVRTEASWLGATDDALVALPDGTAATALLVELVSLARGAGLPMDGWGADPIILTPKDNLAAAIKATWPLD